MTKWSPSFDKYGDAIKADVLGLDVVAGSVDGYEKEWNINGETVLFRCKKRRVRKCLKQRRVFNKKKFINDVTETVRHMYRKQLKRSKPAGDFPGGILRRKRRCDR